jgi:hypothetical protein
MPPKSSFKSPKSNTNRRRTNSNPPPEKYHQRYPAEHGIPTSSKGVRFNSRVNTSGSNMRNVPGEIRVDQLLNEFHDLIKSRIGSNNRGLSVYAEGTEGEFGDTEVLPEGYFPTELIRVPEHRTGRQHNINRAFELYILATTAPNPTSLEHERESLIRRQRRAINTLRHAYPAFYKALELYLMAYVDLSTNTGLSPIEIEHMIRIREPTINTIRTLETLNPPIMFGFIRSILTLDESRRQQGNTPSYFEFFQTIRQRNSQVPQAGGSLSKKKKTHKLKNCKRSRFNRKRNCRK